MSAQPGSPTTRTSRGDLRLRMVEEPGTHLLDGGWWPYSRDLILEMSDLASHFPGQYGRIASAEYARPDWDATPRVAKAGPSVIKLEYSTSSDTHVITLRTRAGEQYTLLVIPPSLTAGQGDEALLAAATPGNSHSGIEVIREVTDHHDVDPADEWEHWGRTEAGVPQQRPPTAGADPSH